MSQVDPKENTENTDAELSDESLEEVAGGGTYLQPTYEPPPGCPPPYIGDY